MTRKIILGNNRQQHVLCSKLKPDVNCDCQLFSVTSQPGGQASPLFLHVLLLLKYLKLAVDQLFLSLRRSQSLILYNDRVLLSSMACLMETLNNKTKAESLRKHQNSSKHNGSIFL